MPGLYTFSKSEKLCGKLRIKHLYEHGKRFTCFPLRVTWLLTETNTEHSQPVVLVWAAKSLFKHAVSRNRLRRKMREAYRLNSEQLKHYCTENNIIIQLAFNYISKEEAEYMQIEKAVRKAISKLTTDEILCS